MLLSATGLVKAALVVQTQEDGKYSHRVLTKCRPKRVHTREGGANATIKGAHHRVRMEGWRQWLARPERNPMTHQRNREST